MSLVIVAVHAVEPNGLQVFKGFEVVLLHLQGPAIFAITDQIPGLPLREGSLTLSRKLILFRIASCQLYHFFKTLESWQGSDQHGLGIFTEIS